MLRRPRLINFLTGTVVLVVAGVVWGLFTGWTTDTAFIATGVGLIGWLTYLHRYRIDNRSEWWRRVQSAIELILVEDDKTARNTGLTLLKNLENEPALLAHDRELISAMTGQMVENIPRSDNPTGRES